MAPSSRVYLELDPEVMALLQQLKTNTENIMLDIAKLTADITAETSVVQSVVVFIDGLKAGQADLSTQIAALKDQIAALEDPTLQAAIDALDATVQNNAKLLTDAQGAITANTSTP